MLKVPEDDAAEPRPVVIKPEDHSVSATQKKKRERAFETLKSRMKEALLRHDDSESLVFIEPLDDEVYEEGMAWLDLQGGAIPPFSTTIQIHPDVWHSKARRSIS